MSRLKFNWRLVGAVLVVDQVCKFLTENYFPSYLNKNSGLPFGITLPAPTSQSGLKFFVVWAVTIALLIFILAAWKIFPTHRTALSLILGGALSNLADRINFGYVRDFLDIGVGTMNLADVAVWIGIGMLLFNIKNTNPNSENQTPNKQQ